MPEVIETTVYRLAELSDEAKDKARASQVRHQLIGSWGCAWRCSSDFNELRRALR